MEDKVDIAAIGLQPLFKMDQRQRLIIAGYVHTEGFVLIQRMFEDEIKLLGLLVEQYLAFAETMAQQRVPMYMADWIQRLDIILQLNRRELLNHAGKISHEKALKKSGDEFEKYTSTQKVIEKEQSLREIEEDIKKLGKPEN